jgi:hypothetical protein
MVEVWHTVFRIAAGYKVDERPMRLASGWFGVPVMTKFIAKQLVRPNSDLHIRFPRR